MSGIEEGSAGNAGLARRRPGGSSLAERGRRRRRRPAPRTGRAKRCEAAAGRRQPRPSFDGLARPAHDRARGRGPVAREAVPDHDREHPEEGVDPVVPPPCRSASRSHPPVMRPVNPPCYAFPQRDEGQPRHPALAVPLRKGVRRRRARCARPSALPATTKSDGRGGTPARRRRPSGRPAGVGSPTKPPYGPDVEERAPRKGKRRRGRARSAQDGDGDRAPPCGADLRSRTRDGRLRACLGGAPRSAPCKRFRRAGSANSLR